MKVRKAIIAAALAVSSFGGLIQSAHAQQVASLTNGPLTYTNRVGGSRSEYYLVRATGGIQMNVELRGDGLGTSPDLDLIIEDDNGFTVCSQTGVTDREQCSLTPARAGMFKIIVKNVDNLYNDYRLTVRQATPNIVSMR